MFSRAVVVLSGGYFLMFFAAGLQQLLLPYLTEATGHTPAECSWVLGTVYFSAVLWRVLGSYTVAGLGYYGSIVLGFVPYLAFPLVLLASSNYWLALGAAFVWGWGAAAVWIAGPTSLLAVTDPARYGRASGVFYGCVHAGQALGVYGLAWIRNHFGWEGWLSASAAVYLAGEVVLLFLPRPRQKISPPSLGAVLGMYRRRHLTWLAVVMVVASVGFGLTLSAMAMHVAERFHVGIVGYVTLGFYVGRLICSLGAGWGCDHWGRKTVLVGGFLLAACGLLVATWLVHPLALFGASFLLGGIVGIVPVAVMAIIGDTVSECERHLAVGSAFLWSNFGVGAVVVGSQYLAKWIGSFSGCFLLFALLYVLCAGICARMKPPAERVRDLAASPWAGGKPVDKGRPVR